MRSIRSLDKFGVEVDGELPAVEIRKLVLEHGLVVIRNFETRSTDELVEFGASLSEQAGELRNKLLHWDFGPVMTMKFDPEAKNYLFSDEEVPFHWDGAFHKEPLFLLFHCEASEGEGGETLFCHTPSILNALSEKQKSQAKSVTLQFKTEKLAHYGGQISIPLLQKHPITGAEILRYADEVETKLNPVKRVVEGDQIVVSEIASKIEAFTYAHSWRAGDLVLADNFSLIHGRRKLRNNRVRKFNRIQVL